MSGMNGQDRYNFLQQEAADLYARLGTATSTEEIQRLTQRINEDINAAFGLLSPDQQRALQEDFLTRLGNVNTAAQDRLTKLQEDATKEANKTLDKIEELMTKLAKDQQAAADKQVDAANKQAKAADTPVDVNVTVKLSGGSLVTDGGSGG